MDFAQISQQITDFTQFLSTTYGSGNALADSLITLGGLVVLTTIFSMLGGYRFSGKRAEKEIARLDFMTEVLHEMSLQITEMNSLMLQEFQKCRGELGSLRQDVLDMKHTVANRPISSRSDDRNVRKPTSFGATGSSGFPSLKGLSL